MDMIKYTATKLSNSNKKGVLKADSDGYYTLVLGGLNCYNSGGAYYPLQGAKELFDSSSILMRRINTGNLKGESGHPEKLPGMNDDQYLKRILEIKESNVCCHFSEIWLDYEYGKNNPSVRNNEMVAIMGKVKPSGPNGPSLKESLENGKENVNFSIRSITKDYYVKGKLTKVLYNILTFDNVTEPGISIANKWDSPALESIVDKIITKAQIQVIADIKTPEVGMEASVSFAKETLLALNTNKPKPFYTKW